MQEYQSKQALIDEIKKTAELFIKEFDDIAEADKDIRCDEVDRTPQEIIAYQLGWMDLIRGWDNDELTILKVRSASAQRLEIFRPALFFQNPAQGEFCHVPVRFFAFPKDPCGLSARLFTPLEAYLNEIRSIADL
jgi:hypothetical protein